MKRTYVLSLALPFLVATAAYIGCGGTDGSDSTGTGANSGGGGSGGNDASTGGTGGTGGATGGDGGGTDGGSGGTGGATGGDGGGTDGGSGGSVGPDAAADVDFSYDAPAYEAPEACATQAVEAQLKPLDLYMMVDRSGSMSGSPWTNQSNALKSFFNDPQSDGLTVAMRFFPLNDSCGPTSPGCNGSTYVDPLVPWGLLPAHAGTLNSAIDGTSPNGCFTPTEEAIYGVLKGAVIRQGAAPDHVVAAVIVSDGAPCCGNCPIENAAGIGDIAAQYFGGTPSIRTFAIYVASAASAVMTEIAQKGGTIQAYNATGGSQAFIDALKAIQGSAIPCDFNLPTPSQGSLDPDKVTLDYLPGGSSTPVTIARVNDLAACGAGDGWYYDNNAAPTKIILCPTTCTTMKADANAKVQIQTGCLGS